MSLRERQREAAVEAILEAATTVFSESGFHRTSMEDIAKACDCAPATIYGYFKGKKALFLAIMETHITGYMAGVDHAVSSTDDFAGGLAAYLDHLGSWGMEHRSFMRLMEVVMRDPPDTHPNPEDVAAVQEAYFLAVLSIVQRGIAEGLLRDDHPQALAASLIGLTHANAGLWLLQNSEGDLRPHIQFAGSLFTRGARRDS